MRKFLLVLFISLLINKSYSQTTNYINAQNLNSEGYLMIEEGRFEESKKYFMKAINLDSTSLSYYYNLGKACQATSDWLLAKKYYNIAKVEFTTTSELFMFSGDVFQELRDYKNSIEDYSIAIILAKSEENVQFEYLYYFNRGNAYLKLKNYNAAIKDYTTTIGIYPEYYGAFVNRGMAKYNIKNHTGACRDWSVASALGNKLVEQYINKYCH